MKWTEYGRKAMLYGIIIALALPISVSFLPATQVTATPVTLITNVWELQNMTDDIFAHYELANDIDASITSGWNAGRGFERVGDNVVPFEGYLNGKGHTISNLYINMPMDVAEPTSWYVGMFGEISPGAFVANVNLFNANITAYGVVGGLVGRNYGYIHDCSVNGSIQAITAVGGLVGRNYNKILGCESDALVRGNFTGGLVGSTWGTIRNSETSGTVTTFFAGATTYIGGISGTTTSGASLYDCTSNADVFGTNSYVGGIVGFAEDTNIQDCAFTGTIETTGTNAIGGIVGRADSSVSINTCRNLADVEGGDNAGGVVGYMGGGSVYNSYSTGDVTGNDYVGGLVGRCVTGDISRAYSTGDVTGNDYVGGLVGRCDGNISSSFAKNGDVEGDNYVGGLIGYSMGEVSDSYSQNPVTGLDSVGGLIGYTNGVSITTSYSTGFVDGATNTGGLIGQAGLTPVIVSSFYDLQTSGKSDTGKGDGKNTSEMKDIDTFLGWSIAPATLHDAEMWFIVSGNYPQLYFESYTAPPTYYDLGAMYDLLHGLLPTFVVIVIIMVLLGIGGRKR